MCTLSLCYLFICHSFLPLTALGLLWNVEGYYSCWSFPTFFLAKGNATDPFLFLLHAQPNFIRNIILPVVNYPFKVYSDLTVSMQVFHINDNSPQWSWCVSCSCPYQALGCRNHNFWGATFYLHLHPHLHHLSHPVSDHPSQIKPPAGWRHFEQPSALTHLLSFLVSEENNNTKCIL